MATTESVSVPLRYAHWEVRPDQLMLLVHGKPARIGSRAFGVLMALVERPGRVVSRGELLDVAWPGLVVEENNLSVQITTLRKVLGREAIATIPGLGYRLSSAPLDAPATVHRVPDDTPPAEAPPRHAGNLPTVLPMLFGREDDIASLAGMVAVHRLVSVIGAGGIGKTRLAQAVAHRLRDDYAGGVWIVELAPLTDPALLPAAVAQARGLTLPGKKAPLEEVIEALGDRPMLLVLDNCEHVVEAAGRFASAVMERTAQLRLLTTSQELLKLTDEQVFRASPLSLPSSNLGSAVEASGAGKLLIHRIGALRRGFALDDTGTADAVEICRRLDGLPLAIELAAGRVPLLGLAGVRELLDERFRVLTGGSRTGLRRHRTLRETLEWSHALLNPDEAAVFRRAAVFAGGFGLKQAQTVLGDEHLDEWAVLELLGAVVDKSLIMVDPVEPPRYRLLESARAFALEKLQDAGEGEATRRRHAQAVLDQFNATFPTQWDAPSQRRTELYLPDLDNCRAALDWAAQGAAELHIALAGACAWLFGSTGQAMEGMRHCERALKRIDSGTPASAEARLQYAWCGLAHYSPGPEKRAAAERAVALYRAIDDVPALYCALGRFAITAALSDDGAAGEEATIEMERLQDRAWPLLARWDLLNARDYVLNMLLRHAEAEALAHEELALALATGDTAKTMFSLMALEQCASTRGDFEEAVTRGRELVAMARRERYVERMQVYVANLATALVMAGQVDEGHVVAREAAGLDSRAGTLWLSLDYLAMLAHKQGRSVDAARVLGRSDAANAWRKACREPVEKRVHDELLRNLQALIPAGELDRLLARGAAMTDEAAAALALDG